MSTCCCCFETYRRDTNPALTCNPCGHGVCEPCLVNWRRCGRSNSNTCPQCRARIISTTVNRDLMDTIEQLQANSPTPNVSHHVRHEITLDEGDKTNNNFVNLKNTNGVQIRGLIHDKSKFSLNVLDNSCSMDYEDGKKVEIGVDGEIRIKDGIMRWNELTQKIGAIADYNVKRKMPSAYYLLNPSRVNQWVENKDYIFIEPDSDDCYEKLKILKEQMTKETNIRGSTPLDKITRYIKKSIVEFVNKSETPLDHICYNIITDGRPDDKISFEKELRYLARNFNILLTINLCTDNQVYIDYYNNLDVKIGTELGALDVIDDFKGEQLEVIKAGNSFITYTYDIHVCRMAGCNSVVADTLDEHQLSVFHANKLVKELLGSPSDLPHWTERESYIKKVGELNKKVYNLYYGKHTDLIDINKLNNMIWFYQLQKYFNDLIPNYLQYDPSIYLGTFVLIILCVFMFF
jgi:hypothetical protein